MILDLPEDKSPAAAVPAPLREPGLDSPAGSDAATPRYHNPRTVPLLEYWDWQRFARCRGEDPAIFFGADFERGIALRHRHDLAKRICSECPVIAECRRHAAVHQEPFGVWGGLSEQERLPSTRSRRRSDRKEGTA